MAKKPSRRRRRQLEQQLRRVECERDVLIKPYPFSARGRKRILRGHPPTRQGTRHRSNQSTGASSLCTEREEAGTKEMTMPSVDFNVLRNETTMEQVLNQPGFQPTSRSANQLHGPGPVHGSTSKRSQTFSVNLDTGRYTCHKCHRNGHQLELWAAVHKLSIDEAAVNLCHVLGREVPWIKR